MGLLTTDPDTQEALEAIEDLISAGYPYIDEKGRKWYGQEARDRIPHLAGQGCGCVSLLAALVLMVLVLAVVAWAI